MTPEQFVALITDLVYAAAREFQTVMAWPIANPQVGAFIRVLPLLALPFGAARSLNARTWMGALLGLSLVLIELYFIYNRLTVFANKPLVLGEGIGNGGLMLLGVLLVLPQRYWRTPTPKEN